MFIDWLKVSQTHKEDLPQVGDTVRITIDKATGDVLHSSEPRYKLEGSYSTSIHIVIQGRTVTVDGNPSRINRQDNLFGFQTIQDCINVYNSILAEYGIPPFTKCTERYLKDGKSGARAGDWTADGACIERVDLTTNVSVGKDNVAAYLRGLSTQRVGHSIGRLFPNGWSVDWTTSGAGTGVRLQYRKAYAKAEELRTKLLPRVRRTIGESSPEYVYALKLYQYCLETGLVRFEQELKSEYLKREHLSFWGLFDEKRYQLLHDDFLKTDEKLKVNSMDLAGITEQLILEHVVDSPKAARTTAMYAIEWMQGVKHDRTKRAFETHAARLNRIGINIRNASDISNVSTVFVRQVREVNPVKELAPPSWYVRPVAPSHLRLVA